MATGMRLAIFLPDLHAGGAERVLLFVADAAARQGIPCRIICAGSGGIWRDRVPRDVELVELGCTKPIKSVLKLWSHLRASRTTVVLSSITSANIAALLASCLPGARWSCVIREANFVRKDMSGDGLLKRSLTLAFLRLLYRRASALIALSRGMKEHMVENMRVVPDRVHVVPNPVPLVGGNLPQRPNGRTGKLNVVSCGRLSEQKDFATLITALAALPQSISPSLTLMGSGPLLENLQEKITRLGLEDRVRILPYCEDPTSLIAGSSLFVLSSRWEGFPNVLLEALASGTPIVSTNCSDAVDEILDSGRFGTIVPVGDASAMARAMADILEGRIAFEDPKPYLAAFHPSTIAARYLRVLCESQRRFVGSSGRRPN